VSDLTRECMTACIGGTVVAASRSRPSEGGSASVVFRAAKTCLRESTHCAVKGLVARGSIRRCRSDAITMVPKPQNLSSTKSPEFEQSFYHINNLATPMTFGQVWLT
jgi:hypothetical protein